MGSAPSAEATAHLAAIEDQGYTLLEGAIDDDLRLTLLDDLQRIERDEHIVPAGNRFEGSATTRVYNLLAHGPLWHQVALHPRALPIVEGVLDPGCLVSSVSSIAIAPGERTQPIHADDQLHPIPRPHPPTVCNSMWALTDFTEANGATRIIPGSHRWDHSPEYGSEHDTIAAEMPAGSILVWNGALWHGGGPNTTDQTRVGIAMNYCAGWIRQQENQQLGLDPEVVATFSPRLRELCGFGIYRGLVGHVDKQSPGQRLYGDAPVENVWDLADRLMG
ncbi:MAG: phytanoyl-CoA dioxygenase [Actinomycetia bacterium]|nr:phytanoyl-CoA dioxygenase [Actinomycetes bacterium]